VLNIPFPDTST